MTWRPYVTASRPAGKLNAKVMAKLRGSWGLPLTLMFHDGPSQGAAALGLAGGAMMVMAKLLGSRGLPPLPKKVLATLPCAASLVRRC